jgi:hypothetical protein
MRPLFGKPSLAGAALVIPTKWVSRLSILVLIVFAPAALAQSRQPYAGLETRSIKALSK